MIEVHLGYDHWKGGNRGRPKGEAKTRDSIFEVDLDLDRWRERHEKRKLEILGRFGLGSLQRRENQ